MVKKIRKSFIALLVVVCLAAGFVLTACGDKPDSSVVTYTVTVLSDDSAPVAGVTVSINKGGASFGSEVTDTKGKVSFDMPADTYEFTLTNLPNLYSVAADANLSASASSPNLTVNLVKAFAYKVNLVNPDNTPFTVAGVYVGICIIGENCLPPVAPVNGVAEISAPKGDYGVIVQDLPETYAYETDSHGYYSGKYLSETVTEVTVPIYPVSNAISGEPMTPSAISDFAKGDNGQTIVHGIDTSKESYLVTAQVKAGERFYIAITPKFSGKYLFYMNDPISYYDNGDTFSVPNVVSSLPFLPQYAVLKAVLKADNTYQSYYITGYNPTSATATARFVVQVPDTSYYVYNGTGGIFDLTVGSKYSSAIVSYTPATAGAFKVSVNSDTNAIVRIGDSVNDTINTDTPDSEFTAGASITETILQGGTGYFNINVLAEEYPATFEVNLERVASASDVYSIKQADASLEKFRERESNETLVGVPMSSETKITYNEQDGYYYYDDNVVLVKLTKPVDYERMEAEYILAYIDMNSQIRATYELPTTKTAAGKGDYTAYVSYKSLIRGFENYSIVQGDRGSEYAIPEVLDVENCYANNVNSEGVYPLTKELETFLKLFTQANKSLLYYQMPTSVTSDDYDEFGWMFPLYYYTTDAVEVTTDAIIGEYLFVSGVDLDYDGNDTEYVAGVGGVTETFRKLVVSSNRTFAVYEYNNFAEDYDTNALLEGTWVNNNGTYTFTDPFGSASWTAVDYTVVFDNANGTISLSGNSASFPSMSFKRDSIIGTYGFVYYDDGNEHYSVGEQGTTADYCTLTVLSDGTFKIESERSMQLNYTGTWSKKNGTYTFTVVDGASDISFNYCNYDYSVEFDAATKEISLKAGDSGDLYPEFETLTFKA